MSKLKKALERAKQTRDGLPPDSAAKEPTLHPLLRKHGIQAEAPATHPMEISYSRTRIEPVDRNLLKRNKILSLFKENQTTDQIDILRTQLLAKLSENRGNSMLVTSAHPGEGKTFTAINLGVSIAQQLDRTVMIVDTDLRHPWKYHYDFAHDYWGLNPGKGLADYLLGQAEIEDILVNPGIEKLTIMPAGRPLPNSAELLGSNRMEQFILEVKNRYGLNRICIFDSPALLLYTDPLVFTHLLDGILLVVEAERTTPADLEKVMGLLEGKPLLGTVFNKSKGRYHKDYV
jgi:non-specific protein-tyrosine kinase